jgi:hypothetical protein
MKKKAAIWADGSDTDSFLLCRAIPSGSLLPIRPYPYTEATYMGDKYYLRHGHLSRMSQLGQQEHAHDYRGLRCGSPLFTSCLENGLKRNR